MKKALSASLSYPQRRSFGSENDLSFVIKA